VDPRQAAVTESYLTALECLRRLTKDVAGPEYKESAIKIASVVEIANCHIEVARFALAVTPDDETVNAAVMFILEEQQGTIEHPFVGYFKSVSDVPAD
jgi:hypothetical protein